MQVLTCLVESELVATMVKPLVSNIVVVWRLSGGDPEMGLTPSTFAKVTYYLRVGRKVPIPTYHGSQWDLTERVTKLCISKIQKWARSKQQQSQHLQWKTKITKPTLKHLFADSAPLDLSCKYWTGGNNSEDSSFKCYWEEMDKVSHLCIGESMHSIE